MNDNSIELTIDEGIARIVLANPDGNNVINARFAQELARAAITCEERDDVRVVMLSAQGPRFSVGGDLKEFLGVRDHIHAHVREMATFFHLGITVLNRMPAPVVCAVNGVAGGGGMSLALMCDLTIAARSARFNLAYTRSGLTPDGGSTWFLPRLVGAQRAFDIIATNPTLDAERACELGLIARVVDDDQLEAEADKIARSLRDLPSGAAGRAKQLLRAAFDNPLERQFELEAQSIAEQLAEPDTLAALERFFAARGS